jgi:hypothetical protein
MFADALVPIRWSCITSMLILQSRDEDMIIAKVYDTRDTVLVERLRTIQCNLFMVNQRLTIDLAEECLTSFLPHFGNGAFPSTRTSIPSTRL